MAEAIARRATLPLEITADYAAVSVPHPEAEVKKMVRKIVQKHGHNLEVTSHTPGFKTYDMAIVSNEKGEPRFVAHKGNLEKEITVQRLAEVEQAGAKKVIGTGILEKKRHQFIIHGPSRGVRH